MKMIKEDYEDIRRKLKDFVNNMDKDTKQKLKNAFSEYSNVRLAWDLAHCVNIDYKRLYKYLYDKHIETALLKILKEIKDENNI